MTRAKVSEIMVTGTDGHMMIMEHVENFLKVTKKIPNQAKWWRWLKRELKQCPPVELHTEKLPFEPKPKQCFNNAWWMSMWTGADYLEGYVCNPKIGYPIHHAWNRLDGIYYDLTLQRLDGENVIKNAYGSVIELDVQEVRRLSEVHKTTGEFMREVYLERVR